MNDMLNIHDRHLTKINSNKFTLSMCPFFLFFIFKKIQICFVYKRKFWFIKKNRYFLFKRKNKIFVKEKQICFCVKLNKGDFIKKNQICFLWIKGIRFCKKYQICFCVKVKKFDFIKKNQICFFMNNKEMWFYQEKSDLFFERGSTFIWWIYYACITFIKKLEPNFQSFH